MARLIHCKALPDADESNKKGETSAVSNDSSIVDSSGEKGTSQPLETGETLGNWRVEASSLKLPPQPVSQSKPTNGFVTAVFFAGAALGTVLTVLVKKVKNGVVKKKKKNKSDLT